MIGAIGMGVREVQFYADVAGASDLLVPRCPYAAAEDDLFWAPVNGVDDLLTDEQVHAAGALVEVPDGSSTTTMVASPGMPVIC